MKPLTKINIALFVGLTGSLVLNSVNANNRFKDLDENLYKKSLFGVPVVANIGLDKTLDVIIDESFTNEQKSHIAQAIRELDMDLKGVKYNIMLNSDKAGIKCINITNNSEVSSWTQSVAKTHTAYNLFYGNIMFPVEIEIYTKAYANYFKDNNFSSKYFSALVKHEMLHVLGFKDVYDESYVDKTIMYGHLDHRDRIFDLSSYDIYMANKIYKSTKDTAKKNIKVTTGEPLYVLPKSILEDEQTLQ